MRVAFVLVCCLLARAAAADVAVVTVQDPDAKLTPAELTEAIGKLNETAWCHTKEPVLVWMTFEATKAMTVLAGGTTDKKIEACIAKLLVRAVLATPTKRAVAVLRIDAPKRTGDGAQDTRAAGPKLSIAPVEVIGKTTREVDMLERVFRARAAVARACYQKELARTPALAGTMRLKVRILADGSVESVMPLDKELPTLLPCLTSNLRRLRYPAGDVAEIVYALTFAP